MDVSGIDVITELRNNQELKELYKKLLECPQEVLAASVVDLWLRMKALEGVMSLPLWEYVEDSPEEGAENEAA